MWLRRLIESHVLTNLFFMMDLLVFRPAEKEITIPTNGEIRCKNLSENLLKKTFKRCLVILVKILLKYLLKNHTGTFFQKPPISLKLPRAVD